MLPSTWTYAPVSAFKHQTDQTVQTGPFGAQLHSDDYVEEGVPFILIRNMVQGGVDDSDMPRILPKDAERLSNYQLKLNDIVFSRVGRVGSCFLAGQEQVGWVISGQLLRLRLNLAALDPRFLVHWIRSPFVERHIGNESVGSTRQSINSEILGNMPVPDVPLPGQVKIAEVLDTLDTAIHETEAIIAKLKAVKQGLLHDLLTRGIDANGELRPPQAEAPHLYKQSPLGWIPNEWGTNQLAELLADVDPAMRSGPFGSALLKQELVEAGLPLLGIDNVHTERFVDTYLRFVTPRKFAQLERYAVRPDDLMITIMGTVGRCCLVPKGIGHALSSKHTWTITLNKDAYSPYLAMLQVNYSPWVQEHFARDQQGGTMVAIRSETLRSTRLPAPPREEQRLIEDRLRELSKRIDLEVDLLTKRHAEKAGLMDDLLTGRVRVTPLLAEAAQQPGSA